LSEEIDALTQQLIQKGELGAARAAEVLQVTSLQEQLASTQRTVEGQANVIASKKDQLDEQAHLPTQAAIRRLCMLLYAVRGLPLGCQSSSIDL
jgi:hypothetical protein